MWIPHCLDNRLIDGGKVVSPTHRPLFYSPETLFLCFFLFGGDRIFQKVLLFISLSPAADQTMRLLTCSRANFRKYR
jgi:hypothetical protein